MKLDYDLIEDICLFKFNMNLDSLIRVNLRDVITNSEGNLVASCEIGDRRGNMQDFFIHMDEYKRLLREKKLKSIGL
jgi:hypothetical protein